MDRTETLVIENARAVTPAGLLEGSALTVEDGRIAGLGKAPSAKGCRRIDAAGCWVMPGFIDLHSDALEKDLEPRPNTRFPLDIVLFELDKKLAACGVTTIFHSVSFAEGEIGVRCNDQAAAVIERIADLAPRMVVDTRIHARFEITDEAAVPRLEALLNGGKIQLLSLMDHTPGQGQFREAAAFENYYRRVYGKEKAEVDEIIERKIRAQEKAAARLEHMIGLCRTLGIPLASHDDDSREKIRWLKDRAVAISEFPVNMEALRAAGDAGLYVCLGAPNVLRGASQGGNLSARKAIEAGYGDILCSDYAPMTLLHAVFTLERLGLAPLHEAVNMVSLRAARAVGIDAEKGSLEEGKTADFILVERPDSVPRILKTFVAGQEVFSTCSR
ncbi:MAG TPA: alpha-D-ribose 1-methylphosphonate 5-triphosphate diphosphatase [Syntrophales bacterium]|nr:alpha-D-ribose 1-methylphosphonate 5-triphosphate diphosphatase [Syntrophobacterales bacterium]HQL91593.1 alpha-D-ribose 1-methylphosphonate 5-triphosphate diphosphatase [Syntrophales bacterium]